jgi:hypothetical protein
MDGNRGSVRCVMDTKYLGRHARLRKRFSRDIAEIDINET